MGDLAGAADGLGVIASAATAPARWTDFLLIAVPRSPAWWLRSSLSLALAAAILAIALPTAFGGGAWAGGVDPDQFFSSSPTPSVQPAQHRLRLERGPNGT